MLCPDSTAAAVATLMGSTPTLLCVNGILGHTLYNTPQFVTVIKFPNRSTFTSLSSYFFEPLDFAVHDFHRLAYSPSFYILLVNPSPLMRCTCPNHFKKFWLSLSLIFSLTPTPIPLSIHPGNSAHTSQTLHFHNLQLVSLIQPHSEWFRFLGHRRLYHCSKQFPLHTFETGHRHPTSCKVGVLQNLF